MDARQTSTDPISMAPPAYLFGDDFPLRAEHMYALQKYVHIGSRLPTTVEDYRKEFGISSGTLDNYNQSIKSIISVYSGIKAHTTVYMEATLPCTVSLATDLVNYAQNSVIYYDAIFKAVQALEVANKSGDEVKVARNKNRVKALVDEQVDLMEKMVAKARSIVNDLQDFKKESLDDQINLERENKVLHHAIADSDGAILHLQREIDDIKNAIAETQKAYHKTIKKMKVIPTWGWVPYIGWVPAVALGTHWGIKAVNMAKKLKKEAAMADEKQRFVQSCVAILAQANTMQDDLNRLMEAIAPAITTIQTMQGAFEAIAGDLQSVKDLVDNNVRSAKAIIADVQIETVLEKWKELGQRGDRYRQVAYISFVDPLKESKMA